MKKISYKSFIKQTRKEFVALHIKKQAYIVERKSFIDNLVNEIIEPRIKYEDFDIKLKWFMPPEDQLNWINDDQFEIVKNIFRESYTDTVTGDYENSYNRPKSYDFYKYFIDSLSVIIKEKRIDLIKNTTDISLLTYKDFNPLHVVEDVDLIDTLIEMGFDVNCRNSRGMNAIEERLLNIDNMSSGCYLEKNKDVIIKLIDCNVDYSECYKDFSDEIKEYIRLKEKNILSNIFNQNETTTIRKRI